MLDGRGVHDACGVHVGETHPGQTIAVLN
jgi:hypothetical protein